ncbi:hypothetical protein BDZ88DRAFT_97165 [Geranomyces variabilis]|nr:hypothetical protein BDZ88DRAFT_97165 [Geranomyces variabilis]KAJ3141673.1 hypothetical protein HDU90_006016 [Geranomyces variabilis]
MATLLYPSHYYRRATLHRRTMSEMRGKKREREELPLLNDAGQVYADHPYSKEHGSAPNPLFLAPQVVDAGRHVAAAAEPVGHGKRARFEQSGGRFEGTDHSNGTCSDLEPPPPPPPPPPPFYPAYNLSPVRISLRSQPPPPSPSISSSYDDINHLLHDLNTTRAHREDSARPPSNLQESTECNYTPMNELLRSLHMARNGGGG